MLKRLIFWEFPRTSWQYDVVVVLILAFISLTPRAVFRDQPRVQGAVLLPSQKGAEWFWIEAAALQDLAESERLSRANHLVRSRYGRYRTVARVEAVYDSDREPQGFLAFTKP